MSYYKVKLSSGAFIKIASEIEDIKESPELLPKISTYKTNDVLVYSSSYTLGYDQVYYIHDSIFDYFRNEIAPENYKRIEKEELPQDLEIELQV